MSRSSSALLPPLTVSILLLVAVTAAEAQLIGLRTTPLAAGNQFEIFPSERLGSASPAIALTDVLADPFTNPSLGSAIDDPRFFASPTLYRTSEQNGGASSVPLGVMLTSGRWFGGGILAVQHLEMGEGLINRPLRSTTEDREPLPSATLLAESSSVNKYAQMFVGRTLDDRLSVGASVMLADINGTDGVEQLFADAWEITEYGYTADVRLGITAELAGGDVLEGVLVYNRFSMTQEVTSVTWELTDSLDFFWTPEIAENANLNKSSTWGAHVGYRRPVAESPWTLGGILTVNRKLHPKIPTYDLTAVNQPLREPIPRDPGDSWAFNLGFGVAYEGETTTFGADLVYEPAVSDTWADSPDDIVAEDGSLIEAGEHTVDNHFVFSNARMNVGVSKQLDDWTLQAGVRMSTFDYRLDQQDHVRVVDRRQTEQWTEWTPTWGVRFPLQDLELRYAGHASSASHFPWFGFGQTEVLNPGSIADGDLLGGGDVLAPPSGSLTPPDATTVTHRLQLSIPFR